MAAIVILIGHNHHLTIPQLIDVLSSVDSAHAESHYLNDVLNFGVLSYLLCVGISDVEKLTFKRETSIVISAYDFYSCKC